FGGTIPRIIGLLHHSQSGSVLQVPVQLRVIVQVQIESVSAGTVKIARQRSKGTLQIWRATRRVVPRVPNLIASRGIKCQGIPVAVKRAVKGHAGVNAVVQGTLDDIGELRIAGGRQHPPVPHHVADGRAALAISRKIWQLIGITKRFALAARTDTAGYVHLRGHQVLPKEVERLPVRLVTRLEIVVSSAAASVHRPYGVSLEMSARGEGNAAEMIHVGAPRQLDTVVALKNITGEV